MESGSDWIVSFCDVTLQGYSYHQKQTNICSHSLTLHSKIPPVVFIVCIFEICQQIFPSNRLVNLYIFLQGGGMGSRFWAFVDASSHFSAHLSIYSSTHQTTENLQQSSLVKGSEKSQATS